LIHPVRDTRAVIGAHTMGLENPVGQPGRVTQKVPYLDLRYLAA